METTFSCSRLRIVLFFVAVCVIPTESSHRELPVQSVSPNSSYVARGEPLLLNVTLNRTQNSNDLWISWYFRRFFATSYQSVFYINLYYGRRIYYGNYGDTRFSAAARDQPSLLLVNTTLNDSGTYWCIVDDFDYFYWTKEIYFNVTIEDEPKAEITCSQKVTLTETEDFSCWCKAIGSHLVPTATWVKNGKTLGATTELRQKLPLLNVSKNEAGTYICRAQLYSLMDEKTTEITIYYSPRISSFQISASQNKSIKLMCVADGLPKPNYAITDSNGKEILVVLNGVAIVGKNSSISNATYTCIAKNNIGQDERRLNINNCPSSLATGQQGSSKSLNKGIEWYMVFIPLIVGIIFGFGLLYGSQWIRRRRRANVNATNQRTQQNAASVIYAEPTTMPSSEQDDYSVPDASPSQTSWEYQELDAVRANEENFYQPLNLTTRMKRAAQSTGQQ